MCKKNILSIAKYVVWMILSIILMEIIAIMIRRPDTSSGMDGGKSEAERFALIAQAI